MIRILGPQLVFLGGHSQAPKNEGMTSAVYQTSPAIEPPIEPTVLGIHGVDRVLHSKTERFVLPNEVSKKYILTVDDE